MNKRQLALYPTNWKELAKACKDAAGWKCERCGIAHRAWRTGVKKTYRVRVAAAHVDHDPGNPHPRLLTLCNQCHLWYDRNEHGRKARRTIYRKRHETMLQAGQLELFDEGNE